MTARPSHCCRPPPAHAAAPPAVAVGGSARLVRAGAGRAPARLLRAPCLGVRSLRAHPAPAAAPRTWLYMISAQGPYVFSMVGFVDALTHSLVTWDTAHWTARGAGAAGGRAAELRGMHQRLAPGAAARQAAGGHAQRRQECVGSSGETSRWAQAAGGRAGLGAAARAVAGGRGTAAHIRRGRWSPRARRPRRW